ncbi:hypothetical protein [Atlantibacter sp.]|uniref:hypothetical protein n=1 Tax=Atlantibacter sp. TaxID=1903473 RepID=UPI0013EFC350|nr:hypothetical protein [Atlantibacter sp.]
MRKPVFDNGAEVMVESHLAALSGAAIRKVTVVLYAEHDSVSLAAATCYNRWRVPLQRAAW